MSEPRPSRPGPRRKHWGWGYADQQPDLLFDGPHERLDELVDRLRDDVVSETSQRDTFQAIAPQVDCGLYLVPKVLE